MKEENIARYILVGDLSYKDTLDYPYDPELFYETLKVIEKPSIGFTPNEIEQIKYRVIKFAVHNNLTIPDNILKEDVLHDIIEGNCYTLEEVQRIL